MGGARGGVAVNRLQMKGNRVNLIKCTRACLIGASRTNDDADAQHVPSFGPTFGCHNGTAAETGSGAAHHENPSKKRNMYLHTYQ